MSWNKVTQFVQQSRSGLINIITDENVKSRANKGFSWKEESGERVLRKYPASFSMPNRQQSNLKLLSLGTDVMANIYSFLQADEICSFRVCNRFTEACFVVVREALWQRLCRYRFGDQLALTDQANNNSYAKYLNNHLTLIDHEYQHVKSLAHCYQALSVYFSRNVNCQGVYGMVCDLFWADDERIAMTLSRNRYWALPTIIVDTEQRVYEFKRVTSTVVRNGPASFLTLSMAAQSFQDASEEYRFMDNDARTNAIPGFIGYAINLLRMKKELEFLKFTVLPILFKNLMVFETLEDKDNYEATLTPVQRINFRGISLDESVDGQQVLANSAQAKVYPCFKWRESRACYFRNYKFLCSPDGNSATNAMNRAKICTHSCSSSHSSCDCKDVVESPLSSAFCTNVARPLGVGRGTSTSPTNTTGSSSTNNSNRNSPQSAGGGGGGGFGTSMFASLDKVVQGIERHITTTKHSLTPLLLSGTTSLTGTSTAVSAINTTAGDCFYVSKVIDDLEKRVERAKTSYTIVRYSY